MSAFLSLLSIFSRRASRAVKSDSDAQSTDIPMDALDIEHLYRDYSGLVYRRALRFLNNESEAEECMHDIFLKVIERADQFKGQSSPATWLYQITTRHCLNYIRDRKRQNQLIELHVRPWVASSQEDDHEAKMMLESVWSILGEELKQICIYHYVDGLSRDEIGRLLNCTGRTIGNRLLEIRHQLQTLHGEPS